MKKIKMYIKKDYLKTLIDNTRHALNWWDLDTDTSPADLTDDEILKQFLGDKIELIIEGVKYV